MRGAGRLETIATDRSPPDALSASSTSFSTFVLEQQDHGSFQQLQPSFQTSFNTAAVDEAAMACWDRGPDDEEHGLLGRMALSQTDQVLGGKSATAELDAEPGAGPRDLLINE